MTFSFTIHTTPPFLYARAPPPRGIAPPLAPLRYCSPAEWLPLSCSALALLRRGVGLALLLLMERLVGGRRVRLRAEGVAARRRERYEQRVHARQHLLRRHVHLRAAKETRGCVTVAGRDHATSRMLVEGSLARLDTEE